MLPTRFLTCLSAAALCLATVACGSDAEQTGNGGPTAPVAGAIEVTTITSGSTLDPDGYTVTVDGSQDQSMGINASVTFTGLAAGDHAVELTGVASNCTVVSPNPQTVTVTAGGTASTTFTVNCAPVTGAIDATTATTGSALDPDGYTMTVDGSQDQSIGVNASASFSDLSAGDHEVELTDVATNCTVGSSNPQTVTVAAGGTASTTFVVSCALALSDKIVFTTNRDGNGEIYVMNADGSNQVNLTNNQRFDGYPDVSPDGTKIAFVSDRGPDLEIHVMNADGSNQVKLTAAGGLVTDPVWSPDGTKIAFSAEDGVQVAIFVVDADGSNPVILAIGSWPAWSPDGRQIAFTRNSEIYVMGPAGQQLKNRTNNPAADSRPAWSPDGTTIAFVSTRDGNEEIYVMSADGSNQVRLTYDPAEDFSPAWSPDGSKIAFHTDRDGNEEIYVMNRRGLNLVRLTNRAADDFGPAWSP